VQYFDVHENYAARSLTRARNTLFDELQLERGAEAFRDSIVLTVADFVILVARRTTCRDQNNAGARGPNAAPREPWVKH
jgi:hypothetical protein